MCINYALTLISIYLTITYGAYHVLHPPHKSTRLYIAAEIQAARPKWAKPVEITLYRDTTKPYSEDEKPPPKKGEIFIKSVEGPVLPMSTTGRPDAPKPISGYDKIKDVLDRGHLMALSLGGPNIRTNIVPQPSEWQQRGEWAQFEHQLKTITMALMGMKEPYKLWIHGNQITMNDPTWNADLPPAIVTYHIEIEEAWYDVAFKDGEWKGTGSPNLYMGWIRIENNHGGVLKETGKYEFRIKSKEAVEWKGNVKPPGWSAHSMDDNFLNEYMGDYDVEFSRNDYMHDVFGNNEITLSIWSFSTWLIVAVFAGVISGICMVALFIGAYFVGSKIR